MSWKRPFDSESSGTGGGEPGVDGKSAYQLAVENGFVGTEAEWLASLEGEPGATGAQGSTGPGVAVGGSTGQILSKTGAADYATGWVDPATGAAMTDAEVLAALNRTTGPVSDTALGNRTAYQALVNPANTGPLSSVLSWLAGAVKGITGETDWKNVPVTTLKTLKTRADSHEGSRNGHPVATTTLDGMMVGADKTKLVTLAAPERAYKAADFTGYSRNFAAGWQSTVLTAPRIVVPALGQPPAGFAWLMDVTGAIRYRPSVDISALISVGFDGVMTNIPHGGSPLFGAAQGAVGIFHNQISPPTLTAGFEITFTSWFPVADTVNVNPGPMPAVRCYLVAV